MNATVSNALRALFNYADSGVYTSNQTSITCPMWCDTGWRDTLNGYDSVAAELVTLISVLNEHVPFASVGDVILLNGRYYSVVQIDAKDEFVTNLIVKSE